MCYIQQRKRDVLAHCGQQQKRAAFSLAFTGPKEAGSGEREWKCGALYGGREEKQQEKAGDRYAVHVVLHHSS